MADFRDPIELDRPAPPPERRRSAAARTTLAVLFTVAAVTGVSAAVIFAYKEGLRRGAESVAPVITAGGAPDKVRPDDPGGMQVPNQDKQVYERLSPEAAPPARTERLLPPPEAPMAPPSRPQAAAASPNRSPADEAKRIKSMVAPDAPPPPAVIPPPPRGLVRDTVEPPPLSSPPPAAAPQAPVASRPAPAPAAQPDPPSVAPAAGGSYFVQLAALRSEQEARSAWDRFKKANPDLLGRLSVAVRAADLGARGTYYRVQAGPFADNGAAQDLCDKLKSRNQGCLVVKP
jgi:hypothetical protein